MLGWIGGSGVEKDGSITAVFSGLRMWRIEQNHKLYQIERTFIIMFDSEKTDRRSLK